MIYCITALVISITFLYSDGHWIGGSFLLGWLLINLYEYIKGEEND